MERKEQRRRTCGKGFVIMMMSLALLIASCSRHPMYPEPVRTATEIEVDANALEPGIPQFFTYRYRNKGVNFFVVKFHRDKILAFLDACAKCYPDKLGYRFDDDHIVCKKCNIRYPISEIERGIGSCFPVRLPGQLSGGKYVIPVLEIEKAAYMF